MTKKPVFIGFDLGDTIMIEETEQKDEEGVTFKADVLPGIVPLLHDLQQQGVILGLIADTRIGTYQQVLDQHALRDLFNVWSISEALGTSKPDRRMFDEARHQAEQIAGPVAACLMVGNNYARDIVGASLAGYDACWFDWNDRYPKPQVPSMAAGHVSSVTALSRWIEQWLQDCQRG